MSDEHVDLNCILNWPVFVYTSLLSIYTAMDNLAEVVDCIHDLTTNTLIQLGSALGLNYDRIRRLTSPRGILSMN